MDAATLFLFQLVPAQTFAVVGFSLAGIFYQGYGYIRHKNRLYLGFAVLSLLWMLELSIRSLNYHPAGIALAAVLHVAFAFGSFMIPQWMGYLLNTAVPYHTRLFALDKIFFTLAIALLVSAFVYAGMRNSHEFFVLAFIPGALLNVYSIIKLISWISRIEKHLAAKLVVASQLFHATFAAFTTVGLLLQNTTFAVLAFFCGGVGAMVFVVGSFLLDEHKTVIQAERSKQDSGKLQFLSDHDHTTGLLNRQSFMAYAQKLCFEIEGHEVRPAVFVIDLDHFGTINATMTVASADIILQAVAERLIILTGDAERVFRIGGDEFVFVLEGTHTDLSATAIGEDILSAFSRPFCMGEKNHYLSVSVGITFVLKNDDPAMMLRRGMEALKLAKHDRNTYRFYKGTIESTHMDRVSCMNLLRHAMDRKEMKLAFQPQVDTHGKLVGAEALIRWCSPELGDVPPATFIPLAEETGLIVSIGEWVIEKACMELARWRANGIRFPMAVNLSARQLRDQRLETLLENNIHKYNIPPEQLHLEITETSVFQSTDESMSILWNLRRQGYHFCIDDFGTGYASLSYLKMLPVHTVKIDKSFIGGLPEDPQDVAVVNAVMNIAKGLGLRVVAEGVETIGQAEFLRSLDCDVHQGFLYSQPLSAQDFLDMAIRA